LLPQKKIKEHNRSVNQKNPTITANRHSLFPVTQKYADVLVITIQETPGLVRRHQNIFLHPFTSQNPTITDWLPLNEKATFSKVSNILEQ
jgi:hypothetical protein